MESFVFTLFWFAFKVWGAYYCAKTADSKNRITGLWAVLGLVFTIPSLIIISLLKTPTKWHDN